MSYSLSQNDGTPQKKRRGVQMYLTISHKKPQLVDVSKFAVTNCEKCAIVILV
jgi:hypothetical protein